MALSSKSQIFNEGDSLYMLLGNIRGIYQYLIFPEFKVEWSMDYNTDHSGIKDRRDLFEARYNDF